jgi:hypothetical protein
MGRCGLLFLACGIAGGVVDAAHAAGTQIMPAGLAAEIRAASEQREPGRLEPGTPIQVPSSADARPVLVPTTREYQWIFRVPVMSIEHRRIAVTAPDVATRAKRWNYEAPALRDKRVKLWEVPEFSCKYPDLILPNECRTVWRGVYVDLPVLVSERGHVDADVTQIRLTTQFIDVDVPRWTWTDKSFRFSLPAIAPTETVQRLQIALNGQRADVAAATDEAIATITREIDAVRASGEDPARLVAGDGSSLDLLAQRQSLQDQRTKELERLADIDAELARLSTP